MATRTRKAKAATAAPTQFDTPVHALAQRVGDGELTALKAVAYREYDDTKGYFVVVDEAQDITGTIWVLDSSVPDRFRTPAGKEITLLTENGEETLELQSRGMKHKLYFFATATEEEDGYLSVENDDLEETMLPAEAFEAALQVVVA